MAQILHKRATTTHAVRAEIQLSTESAATLSRRYGITPKTVRKWRSRDTVEDTRIGPRAPRYTSLTPLEEAAAVTFRQKTLLPLDECLHALQREIPSAISAPCTKDFSPAPVISKARRSSRTSPASTLYNSECSSKLSALSALGATGPSALFQPAQ